MNFYIVDNDEHIIKLLKDIVEKDFNNVIVGTTSDPQQAYNDAMRLSIDVMFVDLNLVPIDGIELIKQIQKNHHYPHFIMCAPSIKSNQLTNAYEQGIDFFIRKPINIAEVRSVIKLAAQNINMSNRLLKVLDLVSGADTNRNTALVSDKLKRKENAHAILRFLGITSGRGFKDIYKIVNMLIEREITLEELNLEEVFDCSSREKKALLQRIRRDVKEALTNLAYMCIDYPENDIILEYANNLFGYENVHREIQRISQKSKRSTRGGSQISLRHFFNGLVAESNK